MKQYMKVGLVAFALASTACSSFGERESQLTILRNEPLVAPPSVAVRDVIHRSDFVVIGGDREHVMCWGGACPNSAMARFSAIWLHFTEDDFSGDVLGLTKVSGLGTGTLTDDGYKVVEGGVIGQKYFSFDSSKLQGDLSGLKAVAERAAACSGCKIKIVGHTDSIGSVDYNIKLSLRRASAVKNWLVINGVEEGRISISGAGKSSPVASNKTKDGRAKNRRAEYSVLIKVEE